MKLYSITVTEFVGYSGYVDIKRYVVTDKMDSAVLSFVWEQYIAPSKIVIDSITDVYTADKGGVYLIYGKKHHSCSSNFVKDTATKYYEIGVLDEILSKFVYINSVEYLGDAEFV